MRRSFRPLETFASIAPLSLLTIKRDEKIRKRAVIVKAKALSLEIFFWIDEETIALEIDRSLLGALGQSVTLQSAYEY